MESLFIYSLIGLMVGFLVSSLLNKRKFMTLFSIPLFLFLLYSVWHSFELLGFIIALLFFFALPLFFSLGIFMVAWTQDGDGKNIVFETIKTEYLKFFERLGLKKKTFLSE